LGMEKQTYLNGSIFLGTMVGKEPNTWHIRIGDKYKDTKHFDST